ncbi:MAG: hypothetical protein ACRDOU_33255 [Streptosporangiaceae bacterium]
MPERVGEHQLAGERQQAAAGVAAGPVQAGQRGDPGPHRTLQVRGREGLAAVWVG